MGYSIFAKVPTTKQYKKLYNFLENNFEYIDCGFKGATLTNDPCYSGEYKENLIGFDYSSGITFIERAYIYNVCHWIAYILELNHFIYDGCEDEPTKDPFNYLFDYSRKTQRRLGLNKKDIDVIHNKIIKLNNKWIKQ